MWSFQLFLHLPGKSTEPQGVAYKKTTFGIEFDKYSTILTYFCI